MKREAIPITHIILFWSISKYTTVRETDLHWRFPSDMRDKKVHGYVFTVDVFIYFVPDGLRHDVRVQIGIVLKNFKTENSKIIVLAC